MGVVSGVHVIQLAGVASQVALVSGEEVVGEAYGVASGEASEGQVVELARRVCRAVEDRSGVSEVISGDVLDRLRQAEVVDWGEQPIPGVDVVAGDVEAAG